MKRFASLSLAVALLIPAPAQAQSGWIDLLTAILPDGQRVQAAMVALGVDMFDAAALDELDDASADMVATFDSNPPEACWAGWWGDSRASVMLLGEVHDAMDAMDPERVTTFLVAGTFLLQHANDNMPTGC